MQGWPGSYCLLQRLLKNLPVETEKTPDEVRVEPIRVRAANTGYSHGCDAGRVEALWPRLGRLRTRVDAGRAEHGPGPGTAHIAAEQVAATRTAHHPPTYRIPRGRPLALFSQSVSHHHTPSRELTAYTHTLPWSSFKCAAGSQHLPMQMHLLLSSERGRRTSGWSSTPFTFYLSSCWRGSYCRERTSVMNQSTR